MVSGCAYRNRTATLILRSGSGLASRLLAATQVTQRLRQPIRERLASLVLLACAGHMHEGSGRVSS